MHGVITWFRTPLPLKVWLFSAAAVPVVLLEVGALRVAVDVLWNVPHPFPWVKVLLGGAYIVILFALGAFLIWRAIQAYPRGRS